MSDGPASKEPRLPAEQITLSKSALMLSPCVYWAKPGKQWYSDRFIKTENRDRGTAFHKKVDEWLKQRQTV